MFDHECPCGARFVGKKTATFCNTCKITRDEQSHYRALLKRYGIKYPNLCASCGIEIKTKKRFCAECEHVKRLKGQINYNHRKFRRLSYASNDNAHRDFYYNVDDDGHIVSMNHPDADR